MPTGLYAKEGAEPVWKTIGVAVLRCGAIYSILGVFGVLYYLFKWCHPMLRRPQPQANDPATS